MKLITSKGFRIINERELKEYNGGDWNWKEFDEDVAHEALKGAVGGALAGAVFDGVGAIPGAVAGATFAAAGEIVDYTITHLFSN